MNSIIKNIREISIILLIGFVLYFVLKPDPPPQDPVIVTRVDTTYVDVLKEVPVYVPQYVDRIVRDTLYFPVPADIDTLAILEDYFATYTYVDTLAIDSLGFGYLTDQVSTNRIIARSILWDYRIPIIKETTTITLPPPRKAKFFIGATIAGDRAGVNYFGPSVALKTKSDRLISIGTGILGNDNVGVSFSIYSKLF